DRVVVHAGDRAIDADAVVIAGGAWSSRVRVDGAPAMPVKPMRGQLIELAWPGGGLPERPVWGAHSYTVPWPATNALLVGAPLEDVGFGERSRVAGVRDLLDGVGELLPGAWQAAVTDVRVGLRPATDDLLPLVGPLQVSPRVVVAAGHYRNGILLAPLT